VSTEIRRPADGNIARHLAASEDISGTPRRRPAVMSDVARLAGVSHQTVSRVINDSQHVRDETRERVLAAMRQLDYRRNSVARALVTGRSNTLGVVSLDTTLYGPASTLFGIEQAAHESGYFITIASMRTLDCASVLEAIGRLRNQGVDGIIVIAPQVEAARSLLQAPPGVPLVALEAGPEGAVPVASIDQRAGAAAATEHLLSLGHATVWHIAGPDDGIEAQGRVAGWRGALEAAGAEVPAPLIGDWSPGSGYALGARLARRDDVSAVFVANDQMALGVLRAMHEGGRVIPGDVSVVGFDDVAEAAYFTPPLTTVRQDFDEMGRRGLRLLLQTMEQAAWPPPRLEVEPRLVVRASTAPPRAR
jgi:DNA-binding LacI/PurR family transcriptional regulator